MTAVEWGFVGLCLCVVMVAWRVEKLQQKIMHGDSHGRR